MNNLIERIWKQGGMVNIEDLRGTAFQAEESAHTFRIRGVDVSGEPLALTGTVGAVFLRADNTDVAITGTITDGAAEVTLTDECYDMPGRFGLTIYVTSEEQTVAVYAAIGSVCRTSSGVVSPETGEDVMDLINAIASAVATIPASYTDLMAAVAPTYSTSALYAVGSYAWYNGKLYRCTTAITSGETWTSAHWTQTNLGSDVSDFKGEISKETYNIWPFESGYSFTGSKYINPEYGYNFNLPAGTYTISAIVASESTAHGYCGVIFRKDTTVLATANVTKAETRSYKKVELNDTCNNMIFFSAGTSSASTGVNGSWTNIMITVGDNEKHYIPHLTATDFEVRRTVDAMKYDDVVGYKKPNLIQKKFVNTTIGGAPLTVDADGVVTINGTTTSAAGTNVSVTLNRGKYILSGISGGGTGTYWYRLVRADSSYKDVTNGQYEFEVTSETENVNLWIRVKSGNTINTKIYPMIRDASIYDWTYAPYGEYAIRKPVQSLINYTEFNWSGKKMNVLGDSIVEGSWGNFVDVTGGILNLSTVRNYGIGGSRIASTDQDEEYPPAVTQYADMDNDAQIIVVHSGTNDYSGQVPLGSVDSQDITTFNGALNVLMEGLRAKYQTSLIIFSNILRRYTDDNDTNIIKANEYRQALEAACRRHQIVFYNGYTELPFSPHGSYNDGDGGHYMHDGLHLNQTGANVMGRSIAGFIKWH